MVAILPGLVAGLSHVFSGPDHLAALAPWSVEQRGRAWITGVRWGLGHTGGVLLVGLFSLWLRDMLPLDWLSLWAERLVGLVLVGVGLWGVRQALRKHLHTHEHEHNGWTHSHIHAHRPGRVHSPAAPAAHSHAHGAFGIGALHGAAGGSHLLGILPALAFPTTSQALLYLAAFGIGTVVGMVAFTSIVGLLAKEFAWRGNKACRGLMLACSTAAVMIGAYWLVF